MPDKSIQITQWLPVLGAVTGTIGTALGIWNAIQIWKKDTVRLDLDIDRFIVAPASFVNTSVPLWQGWRVTITNIGFIDTTIQTVELEWDKETPMQHNTTLPQNILPRNRLEVIFDPALDYNTNLPEKFRFRITTACKKTFYTRYVNKIII